MTVIDLGRERAKREGPDEDCISYDDQGVPLYTFALHYEMDGKTWAADIPAYSWEDAENRVNAMKQSLTVAGRISAIIPA